MKKGLITAVSSIALAIAANGFALAPTIGDVPDVIIGDAEDNPTGQTIDMNFFRYNNALNLMNYVNATDSTDPGELIFGFDEAGTGNTLDIVGGTVGPITQLTNPAQAPTLWPVGEKITNQLSGSFLLSFRNIALSPRRAEADPPAGSPFPSPQYQGHATTRDEVAVVDQRQVTLFVGDEADNVASKVITVYTKNASNDSLSGTSYTTIFTQSAFPGTDIYGWAFTQFTFTGFAACTSSTGSGTSTYLGMTSGALAGSTKSGAFFERWWQPGLPAYNSPIPHIDGNVVYCAKLRLTLEGTTNSRKGYAPDIRFGVENTGQQLVTTNLVASQNFGDGAVADDRNPQLPDLGVARDYKFYWSPNPAAPDTAHLATLAGFDWRKWRMFFDITDADVATAGIPEDAGTWKVSYVEVGWVPRPADIAPVTGSSTNFKLTDLTSTGGFAVNAAYTKNGTVNQNSPSAGKITFNINARGTTATSVLWERINTAPWIAGKIIRVTARLSCPAAADRTGWAQARIRHQGIAAWVAQVFQIRRQPGLEGGAGVIPYVPALTSAAPTGTPYECYLPSYGGPNAFINGLVGLVGAYDPRYFILGIDHVENATTDTALQWTVHEMLYETLDEASQLMP